MNTSWWGDRRVRYAISGVATLALVIQAILALRPRRTFEPGTKDQLADQTVEVAWGLTAKAAIACLLVLLAVQLWVVLRE